jgi:N6-adenosine-specific RNA methylase IME4
MAKIISFETKAEMGVRAATRPVGVWPFGDLPRGHYGAIYADPPWRFAVWGCSSSRSPGRHYATHETDQIAALPVAELAADDCALFLWISWPMLADAFGLFDAWGFKYKTCAFAWIKAHIKQPDLFRDDADAQVGLGRWTRANSEVCLLATRGNPKRLHADVRQGIIEPRREHSRKPDCVPKRIERLVAGPYLELFARTTRTGWDCWGNETDKFTAPYNAERDSIDSYNEAVRAIGARVRAGAPLPDFFKSSEGAA